MKIMKLSVVVLLLLAFCGVSSAVDKINTKKGVYEYVIEKSDLDFEQASEALLANIDTHGFHLLAKIDATSPDECSFRARVFTMYDSAYAEQLLQINRLTAPFAVVDRMNLFEDESGVHVSIVNPMNINRTILLDDLAYTELSETHRQALRTLITDAVPGEQSDKQYGKIRKKGHIGKTMGVMAGGSFDGKIKDVVSLPDADFADVVFKLETGLNENNDEWGMKVAYELNLTNQNVVIFGSTSPRTELKSFNIVKAGSDKSRKKFACPGIAHAAGYPIEVVVSKEDDGVKVRLVNIMFRMKMYFEDAGKWAFMKNMGMPGSIQDELQDQIKIALGLK